MNKKKFILMLFTSIIMTCLLFLSNSPNIYGMNNLIHSNSWYWIIILIIFYKVTESITKIKNKRLLILSLIIGSILSTLDVIGYYFSNYVLFNIPLNITRIIFILSRFIVNTYIFTTVISNLYMMIENYNIKEDKGSKINSLFKYSKKNFLIITVIIFLAYVPWLLHYFPGICSPDSTTQMLQITSEKFQLTNHHPILHTAVISICLSIGNLIFNSNNAGIAIYSILQMLACALTFSTTIFYLEKKKVPVFIRQMLMLFFMFCPIIASYSITMWKDIPFALSILISTLLLIETVTNSKEFFNKKKNIFLLILFLLLSCLFRKNGLYCVIFSGIISIIVIPKDYKKKLALAFLIPIIIAFMINGPLLNVLNIKQGDSKEALSVPMQQFARVRKYHSDDLTKKEKEELDKFFINKTYVNLYDPVFADPVKRVFSEEYIKDNKGTMVKVYLKYAFKYPTTTIKAFIAGSYGYYYSDLVGWEVFNKIYEDKITKELNIKQTPIYESLIIEGLERFLNSHNLPILSMFNSCGFYFWILIIIIGFYVYQKKYMIISSLLLTIGVWGTALLSPVFCEKRYVYSLFVVVPTFMAILFSKEKLKR